MSKKSINDSRLYVIVDRAVLSDQDPCVVTEAAIQGGADVIQWRDKHATELDYFEQAQRIQQITQKYQVPLIVNDRIAVALRIQADGVHVGHEDMPVLDVRELVGPDMLVGRSTHSLEEALQAQADGADYIGVGPVFATPTKPDYQQVGLELIEQVAQHVSIPFVAIGGIDPSNLTMVLSSGATFVAVVRAIAGQADPKAAAEQFQQQLSSFSSGI